MGSFARPVLAPLLRNRPAVVAVTAVAVLHLAVSLLNISIWTCPARAVGVPCPGCGLTRGVEALFHLDLGGMLHFHAFAPLLVGLLGLVAIAAIIPTSMRQRLADGVERFERRTTLVTLTLLVFVAYWVFRVLWLREQFWDTIFST